MSALVPLNRVWVCVCESLDSRLKVPGCHFPQGAKDRCLLSLSAELSSSFLALSPLFSPSGRLSAELLFSFLAHSPFPLADDDDCDDRTKDWPASGSPPRGGVQARQ